MYRHTPNLGSGKCPQMLQEGTVGFSLLLSSMCILDFLILLVTCIIIDLKEGKSAPQTVVPDMKNEVQVENPRGPLGRTGGPVRKQ